jgi:hypothetical protein
MESLLIGSFVVVRAENFGSCTAEKKKNAAC